MTRSAARRAGRAIASVPGVLLLMGVILSGLGPGTQAEDWPWFLGSTHLGISHETDLAKKWPASGPPVLWKATIGEGYSAPSVVGDRVIIHHRIRKQEFVDCLKATTGERLWRYETTTSYVDPYGYNGGPRATPLIAQGLVIAFGPEGRLICLDLEHGQLKWEVDCAKKWRVPEHFFGFGCSPIIDSQRLIVLVGGQPNSGVVAFDLATGNVLWEAVGKSTWDGCVTSTGKPYRWTGEEMVVSYSSPVIHEVDGKRHLLCLMRQGLVSLDPETGKERFHYWFRARVHESVNAARPVVWGRKILLVAAYEAGSVLLELQPGGTGVKEVWKKPDQLQAHWSTPFYDQGVIYGFSGRHENGAMLQAVDAESGELLWEESGLNIDAELLERSSQTGRLKRRDTGEEVPWPFFGRGSKIRIGDRYILWSERGTLMLGEFSRKGYREVSRTGWEDLTYPTWVAPVLAKGQLYLRDEDTLLCLDVAEPRTEPKTPGK